MSNITKLGYYKAALASPKLEVANPVFNVKEMIKLAQKARDNNNLFICFPELSISSYTCEDLFHNQELLNQTKDAVNLFLEKTKYWEIICVFGLPYQTHDGRIYNIALVSLKGKILGGYLKSYLPNYNEFYESRYFTSGVGKSYLVEDFGQTFELKNNQLFKIKDVVFGVEICEDLWSPIPPSSEMGIAGANVILNLSASNELVGKAQYRKDLIGQQSSRLNCVYLYASASSNESSKDVVFGGHCLGFENGNLLAESERFNFESELTEVEFDINKIMMERRKNTTFEFSKGNVLFDLKRIDIDYSLVELTRTYSRKPFVPSDEKEIQLRAEEILKIQSTGLQRRLQSIPNNPKIVLGLSGGLDSTLAALVAVKTLKNMNRPMTDLVTISMPGFGTSKRTKNQSKNLAKILGSTFLEIDITKAVKVHLEDISQPKDKFDNTYENAQARERTQILFDFANKEHGIVLGTGDLSEGLLGWSTFGGDHLNNYNVNASIPKTLVKYLIKYYADFSGDKNFKKVLTQILETIISPELLPNKDGKQITQSTEDVLGPYDIHDFIGYHLLRNGFSREKIEFLVNRTFETQFSKEIIEKTIKVFFNRYENNQFKRTTIPPGIKVGSVSLSSRGDLRQPDEAKLWKK